eukprot:XP_001695235.1 predicted protein [Chlamydomonas reinhardtii]
MRTATSAAGVVSGVASPSLLPPDAATGASGRGASPSRGMSPSRWQQQSGQLTASPSATRSPSRSGLGMHTAPRAPALVIPPPRLSGSGSAAALMAVGGSAGSPRGGAAMGGLPQSPSMLSGMRRANTPGGGRSPRVSGSGEPEGSGRGGDAAAVAAAAAAAASSPRGSLSGTGGGAGRGAGSVWPPPLPAPGGSAAVKAKKAAFKRGGAAGGNLE